MNRHQLTVYRLCGDATRFGGLSLWLLFRLLPVILVAGVILLGLGATMRQAVASPGEAGTLPDDLGSGQMFFREAAGGAYIPAVMQASKVHFEVSGMIATVTVEQAFSNRADGWMEGVYAFPLPDTAAVRAMEMEIGERRIVGRIRERAEAKKIYREARSTGRKASLVEQQRPNLFTNRVANIGPGETVTVRLEYVQRVEYLAGRFQLRFPTTITARYMPGAPLAAAGVAEEDPTLAIDSYLGWALPTTQVADADTISPLQYPRAGSERAPLNPIQVSVKLDAGMPLARVDAPYHDIVLARRAGIYDIRLASGASEMDRDFVLNWEPVVGSVPAAALFTEQVDGDYYGLLMVLPPPAERAPAPVPREIVFVVDTSGSMGGVSIEQARRSVEEALRGLRPEDYFNIIEFNSSHHALYRRPVRATRHYVERAREFLRQLRARGGTEMLPALRAALAPADADLPATQAPLRQVVFITDGAVGNEVALFEQISSELGNTRLFTVGIGPAPNSWFMREAARFGRGSHTHIGSLDEVGEKMAALFEQLARPAAVDLALSWPQPVEAWPARVPDLYLGEPLLVAVSYGDSPPAGELAISGRVGERDWQQRVRLWDGRDPATAARHAGVASLWARQKIAALLDQQLLGRSREAVRAEVLPLALQHRLLSPFTSFVAVEQAISRPPSATADSTAVPNTPPQGQSPQGFAYPRTATTGPAKLWLGLLLLFLGTLLRVMRRPELDHGATDRE